MHLRQIHREDIWPLAWTSLNVKVIGHQGQKCTVHSHHPLAATEWNALAANNGIQQQTGPFCRRQGVISAACMHFVFGKTS